MPFAVESAIACLLPALPLGTLALAGDVGGVLSSPTYAPALAFGLGALLVSLSATNALRREGRNPWLPFGFPRPLVRMLLGKSVRWIVVSCAYTALALCLGLRHQPLSRAFVGGAAYAFIGAILLACLGVALSVRTPDPPSIEKRRRGARGMASVLLVLLAGAFGAGFFVSWSVRGSLVALLGAVTFATWHSAAADLPLALAPDARRRPGVTLADGLSIALVFTVLQPGLHASIGRFTQLDGWPLLAVCFATSGLLVAGGAGYAFHRRGVVHLAQRVGWVRNGLRRSLWHGAVWGTAAVAVALLYTYWPRQSSWGSQRSLLLARAPLSDGVGVAALVTVALVLAPLAEEVLFRGLIYRGFRQTLSTPVSAGASALVFALAHPGQALLPIFVMALFAAMSFERARSLAAPMLVHLMYNGALIASAAL